MTLPAVTLAHHTATTYPTIRAALLDIHDEVWGHTDDPLADRQTFAALADRWATRTGYACVLAHDQHGTPVGYAYGAPLSARTTWWAKVTPPLPPDDVVEDGRRTFALSELMVLDHQRGTGTGKALHDSLLRGRPEQRVTLLAHLDHPKVLQLYQSWGYRMVGQAHPFDGAPRLAALLLHT